MTSRFVRPETAVLTISDGDTLVVRKRLTSGEQRAQYARMYLAGMDGRLRMNPLQSGMALMCAYLLDWSLRDDTGQPVVIRDLAVDQLASIIDGMSLESFEEIKSAIEAHEQRMVAERDTEKNSLDGAKTLSAISPSLVVADGSLIGSAT